MPFSASFHPPCCLALVLLALSCAAQQVYIQTSDPRIEYSPDWSLTEGKLSHTTYTTGATASFSFEGTYIGLRSTRSSTQGVESINLDGLDYVVNCSWRDASTSATTVVVFEKDDLTPTLHSIKFTKTSPPELMAVVWDFLYTPLSGAATAAPASTSGSMTSNSGMQDWSQGSGSGVSGATIGAAAGASVLFLILVALIAWFFIRRRRRSRKAMRKAMSKQSNFGNEEDYSKESPVMMRSVAGHPAPLADYAPVQRYPEHMYPANMYPAKSIDDSASMMDEDAPTPAQIYASEARSQSRATDDTVSIAPSSRAQSNRDRPPTYITSRTRAMGGGEVARSQDIPSFTNDSTSSSSSYPIEQSDRRSRQPNTADAKLVTMADNNVAGAVVLEDPTPSVLNAFKRKKRSVQDEKVAHLAEEDMPGGAVLVDDPSPSLLNALGLRQKRSVQNEKVAHLMESDAPGALMLEDPSPSLRHGFAWKN